MANKEDFQIIADDAADLILAIWRLQEKSETPKKWTSPEIRDMVGNLKKYEHRRYMAIKICSSVNQSP
jgi:hypothetical protein